MARNIDAQKRREDPDSKVRFMKKKKTTADGKKVEEIFFRVDVEWEYRKRRVDGRR